MTQLIKPRFVTHRAYKEECTFLEWLKGDGHDTRIITDDQAGPDEVVLTFCYREMTTTLARLTPEFSREHRFPLERWMGTCGDRIVVMRHFGHPNQLDKPVIRANKKALQRALLQMAQNWDFNLPAKAA